MTRSSGDIDITREGLDALRSFGTNHYPVADVKSAAAGIKEVSDALPSGSMAAGEDFLLMAHTSAMEHEKFSTDVELGFGAFREGALKMAESFDAADQQMAWTMADVTKSPGEPAK